MIVPLALLAILAFVVVRSLMAVVAHEDVVTTVMLEPESRVRARADDAARALLLPAAPDPTAARQRDAVDLQSFDRSTQLG